ncbi:MAG: cytochrome c [Chloroflexota bacterium]|nr:MAG: cytochrome c [Chloroflexota bacterium]
MPSKGTDLLMGTILILAGLVAGVVIVAALYQWGNTVQAENVAALATPTMSVPVSKDQGAPAASSASGAAPAAASGAATAAGNAAAGQIVFATSCNACHPNGGAGMGPEIKGLPGDKIKQLTRQGRGSMPAFPVANLSDQQLADIAAYLTSGSGAAAPSPAGAPSAGSAAAGQTAFAANCGACHPNGGAGVGPAAKGVPVNTITQVVRQGRGAMPAFPASRLSDQQLADIVAYLK